MTDLNFTEETWAGFMEKYFRWARNWEIPSALTALDAAHFYGFRCTDVSEVCFYKHGHGEGAWFRLKDGRVFDAYNGLPSDPDPALYLTAQH